MKSYQFHYDGSALWAESPNRKLRFTIPVYRRAKLSFPLLHIDAQDAHVPDGTRCVCCGKFVAVGGRWIHEADAGPVPCEPPCGPDPCTRRRGTIMCRLDRAALCEEVKHCLACFGGRLRGEPFNHLYHRRSDSAWASGCACEPVRQEEAASGAYMQDTLTGDVVPLSDREAERLTD